MLTPLLLALVAGDEVRAGAPLTAQLARPDSALELKLYAAGDVTLALESLDFDVTAKLTTSSGGLIDPRVRWQVAGDEHLVFKLPDTGPFLLHVSSEDDMAGEFTATLEPKASTRPDGDALDKAQIEHWRAAAERALARGAPERATELLWTAAERHWRRNEPEATRDILYQLLAVPDAAQAKPFGPLARMHLGLCEMRLGSADVALPMLDSAANEIDLLGVPDRTVELHAAMAEIHVGAKRYERADDELARCADAIAQMDPEERGDFEKVLVRRAEVRQDVLYLQGVVDPHATQRAFLEAVAEIDRRLASPLGKAGLKLPPAPPDLVAELRAKIGPDGLLIVYAPGTSFCFEHMLSAKSLQAIARGKGEIETLVSFGAALQAEAKSAGTQSREQQPMQERGMQSEIEFAGKVPARWFIVPTPELAATPFDAIVTPRKSKLEVRYLVDDARVDVLPSPTLLFAAAPPALREDATIAEIRFGSDPSVAWINALGTGRDGRQAPLLVLWDSPELSAVFQTKFGRGGMSAADALQAAKLELRAKPETSAPRYWAGLRAISVAP